MEVYKEKNKTPKTDTDNRMVTARGKAEGSKLGRMGGSKGERQVEESKGRINSG